MSRHSRSGFRRVARPRRRAPWRRAKSLFGSLLLVCAAVFAGAQMFPEIGSALSPAPAQSARDFRCQVASITDGDTLRCQDGTRIRLHAIAARETDGSCSPGHPCPSASASVSREALTRLAGREIECDRVGTSYNRVTAICWNSAGVEINCAMVRSGAAALWDRFNRQEPICR